ncbi:MAG: flagellar positioning protein PflI [Proteobacteria bacterium]|nr:flagellar positioning protein PflI [Pseudomonadota bacterium]
MDMVTVAMDLLLATLLVAALAYGIKLERKLKALRDSQAGFAEAVQTLDAAAARAEAGLEALRQTTEAAHDELHDRILKARELKAELDKLMVRAERATEDAKTALAAAPERPRLSDSRLADTLARSAEPRASEPRAERPRPSAPPHREAAARPSAPVSRRPAARGLDEDLFETESAPRARAFGVDR